MPWREPPTKPPKLLDADAAAFPSEGNAPVPLPDDFDVINRLDATFNVVLDHTEQLTESIKLLTQQVHAVRARAERNARKIARLTALLQAPDEDGDPR